LHNFSRCTKFIWVDSSFDKVVLVLYISYVVSWNYMRGVYIGEECYYHYIGCAKDQNKSCTSSEVIELCSWTTFNLNYWGPERPRTGGWSLLVVMSDWQRGVDWFLAEYCRYRLQLDLHWCRWRASAKGLSLPRPLRSGDTSRLGSMDPVAERDQVRVAWWQEKQDEVVDISRCRVVPDDWSLHAGFAAVHHKNCRLLCLATIPRPEARRVETGSGHSEKLRYRGTRGGFAGLASGGRGLQRSRDRPMGNTKSWPYYPWGVCIFIWVLGVAWSSTPPGETSYT
jgi:hypothetical protein